jgi:hypothetical protein
MSGFLRTTFVLISCFAVTSCSKSKDVSEIPVIFPSAIVSNVPTTYKPLYSGGLTEEDAKTLRGSLPYDSINIRRTPCFGTCPVYELVLHRDGSAELNAQAHLPRLGKFIGEVRIHTYGRLCYLIESSRFHEMSSSYRANWTDSSTCIVTVTSGTTVKAVSDYGGVGPIQLWAIQELLDAVKAEIEWKAAK